MRELATIVLFSLVVICGFAGYTTYGLPLIIPEAPPVEEKMSGDMTMDQYLAIGKKIFEGKGTCTLCHNPVGGRAPMLATTAQTAMDMINDERYKGEAKSAEEYIRESLIKPSAFVVPGFGKKGTNDTVSPMPNVSKGAIGLNESEINAVVGYLQTMAGVEVTISLPSADVEMAPEEEEGEIQVAESPAEALEKFECSTCHMHPLIEEGGDMGPDLGVMAKVAGQRKKGMTARDYIIESINDPNAFIVEEFDADMMPDDYPARMTVAEFNMIVDVMLENKE